MIGPDEALASVRQWERVERLGGSSEPLLVVDLRGIERSFRRGGNDSELATLLTDKPWVNVAVVNGDIDGVFAELIAAFDIVLSDSATRPTTWNGAIAVDDLSAEVARLRAAVGASPQAATALVQLLRLSHAAPVAQALNAESVTYAMLQTSDRFQTWLGERPSRTIALDQQSPVDLSLDSSLLRIVLNRPKRRNALNVAMRDALMEAFELVDLDHSIDGAVVSGAGANFCSGGDLDEFGSTPSPARGHDVRMLRSLGALVHRLRERVRFHVHGSCVGAGIELPAFAATVIAAPDATFRLPEVGFGLVPGAGGTVSITRRCGRHRTAWLALTGATLDAQTALSWHLVDRIDAAPAPPDHAC